MTATAVFPVGHGAGPFVLAEETAPAHHLVRVGRTPEQLTEAEFATWVLAHYPAEPDGRAWTVADLVAAGPDLGLPDVEQQIAALLSRGILVEVTDPAAFAHQYRMASLFLGLGNRPDDLDQFAIGVPGLEPLAIVGSAAFELWQWGWVAPSLWAHCEVLATIGEQEADAPSTPEAQLGPVLGTLPSLLAGFVAFLEPVMTPPPSRRRAEASAGR